MPSNIHLSLSLFQTKKTRNVIIIDKTAPQITLQGNKETTVCPDQTYQEEGYTASDNCDGDLTTSVKVEGIVNTNQAGTYKLTYTIKDKAGNETTTQRTIIVTSNKTENRGVIYLTFDDGPSYTTTPKVLEILKEENIKATFFVIGTSSSFNEYVKREYNEGHTIALHSNTHNYSTIYSSPSAYWADLTQIQNKVNNVIGIKPTIIRFPGGSSNTVSRRYYSGIMTILTQEVTNNGYHYFDWNVLSGDAGDVSSSAEVYNNVTSTLSHNRANVVLMHDFENNNYTLGALRDIIKYAKANGYTFDKITENTKEVHHRVNN